MDGLDSDAEASAPLNAGNPSRSRELKSARDSETGASHRGGKTAALGGCHRRHVAATPHLSSRFTLGPARGIERSSLMEAEDATGSELLRVTGATALAS